MRIVKNLLLLALLAAAFATPAAAQQLTQTVRGTVLDQDSREPAIGAHVVLLGTENFMGATTDIDGTFRIPNVPVGRINLKVTYMGYEDKMLSNVLVGAGKELVLTIEMVESVVEMEAVQISATESKTEVLNEMATVSARQFSVEETKRYAGSFNDPARMVSSFAGVATSPEGDNDIIVRGNTPRGVLWRLEGVEIPNPNHFAGEGTTGGPINALNSAMLDNSDFFAGAFAPEYGNAMSGVFDMRLRNGNNEQREYSLQAGVLGTDATIEGPFKRGYNGSYLANYRYSSLAILDQAGIVDFGGVPKYQDASFKLFLPAGKAGVFTIWGLGGISSIDQKETNEAGDSTYWQNRFHTGLGVVTLNHTYRFSKRTYAKSYLSLSGNWSGDEYEEPNSEGTMQRLYDEQMSKKTYRASTTINTKINARHRLQSGVIFSRLQYDFFSRFHDEEDDKMVTDLNSKGTADQLQGFVSWKYRMGEDWTLVSGMHYNHFLLNNTSSIEPRAGLKWQFAPNKSLNAGFGIHSKPESLPVYLASEQRGDGVTVRPNKNIGLPRAQHYVLGYDHLLNENMRLKAEVYYQHLYNIPVSASDTNTWSQLNAFGGGFGTAQLDNSGTGTNYGLELTLERFFADGYYYMLTASVFDSKYTDKAGNEFNTRFNSNYVGNLTAGKEWAIGNPTKSRTLGVNTRVMLLGGKRYSRIMLAESREKGYTVRDWDTPWTERGDDIFRADLGLTYRRDKGKTTREVKLDIQNVTNAQGAVDRYYSSNQDKIVEVPQLGLLPTLSYRIQF